MPRPTWHPHALALPTPQPDGVPLAVRVGVHTGAVMSGVVGLVRKKFTLLGDSVNVASRMESTSEANTIQISEARGARGMRGVTRTCQPTSAALAQQYPPVLPGYRPMLSHLLHGLSGPACLAWRTSTPPHHHHHHHHHHHRPRSFLPRTRTVSCPPRTRASSPAAGTWWRSRARGS